MDGRKKTGSAQADINSSSKHSEEKDYQSDLLDLNREAQYKELSKRFSDVKYDSNRKMYFFTIESPVDQCKDLCNQESSKDDIISSSCGKQV